MVTLMAEEFLYGDQTLALFPDNTSGLISAQAMRSFLVSIKSGGMFVEENALFTIPIVSDTPVSINPLLPSPISGGTLWIADGNNRGLPNYQAAIPTATIPPGYSKFTEITFFLAAEKGASGEDQYLFQIDLNGVPIGNGITTTLTTDPGFITIAVSTLIDISNPSGNAIGLSVTGLGTSDDIAVSAFEMNILDDQIWSAPA